MSKQSISILGAIGQFKIGETVYNGVTLKQVNLMVAALPADTTELEIKIAGPGGHKETGDLIYDFLLSQKAKGWKLITNQVGDIGSIATKLFLVGDERVALKGINPVTLEPYEFFIHNPWNTGVSGDAAVLAKAASEALVEQKDLLSFYIEKTGATEEALQPLMSLQTGFTAEEAVTMKFATSTREALNTAAYMDDKTKSLGARLDSVIAMMEKLVKGKNSLAMVLELENGTKISVATEDANKLEKVNAMTVDAAGVPTSTPVPDGSYKLKDGSKTLVVVSGVIDKVEPVAAPAAKADAPAAVDPVIAAKLEKFEALQRELESKDQAAQIAALVKKGIDDAMVAFKDTLTSEHRPPHKDIIIDLKDVKESPAQARNRENAERAAKK